MFKDELKALENGRLYAFRDWPNSKVPLVAAGTYTVWQDGHLLYTGMSGRGWTANYIKELRERGETNKGLWSRLKSHASGQRSGDKFCIYICDRFVLRKLTQDEIDQVISGTLSLDDRTRKYVRECLSYRFVEMPDGKAARALENRVKQGELSVGKPFLNPA